MSTRIVFAVYYITVGLILAIPYCLLAGWNVQALVVVTFVLPAFLMMWTELATLAGILNGDHLSRSLLHVDWRASLKRSEHALGSVTKFWLWCLFCFLPIICNLCGWMIQVIGYTNTAELVNRYRYWSTPIAMSLTAFLLVLNALFTQIKKGNYAN